MMEEIPFQQETNNTFLTQKQFKTVNENLSQLAEKLNITAVLIVNSTGQLISDHYTRNVNIDKIQMTSITAGSYSAAKEIARIIGEKANFKMILHEGEQYNVFIATINHDYFLIVLFEKSVAVGMVRLFTKKTAEQLLPVLSEEGQNKIQMDQIFNQKFQTLLNDKLDRSFTETK